MFRQSIKLQASRLGFAAPLLKPGFPSWNQYSRSWNQYSSPWCVTRWYSVFLWKVWYLLYFLSDNSDSFTLAVSLTILPYHATWHSSVVNRYPGHFDYIILSALTAASSFGLEFLPILWVSSSRRHMQRCTSYVSESHRIASANTHSELS